jgi:hypothetical protein
MNEDQGGIPDVPQVIVEDPHWKVADGMPRIDGSEDFIIGQIAVVDKGGVWPNKFYDVVFFDTVGTERGRIPMKRVFT